MISYVVTVVVVAAAEVAEAIAEAALAVVVIDVVRGFFGFEPPPINLSL